MFQFLPLSVFALVAFQTSYPSPHRWLFAYALGCLMAVLRTSYTLHQKKTLNRIALGSDLYLFVGLTASILQSSFLIQALSSMRESLIFLCILSTGITATFVMRNGFSGVDHKSRKQSFLISIVLVAAASTAFFISYSNRGDRLLGAVVPLVALAIFYHLIAKFSKTEAV